MLSSKEHFLPLFHIDSKIGLLTIYSVQRRKNSFCTSQSLCSEHPFISNSNLKVCFHCCCPKKLLNAIPEPRIWYHGQSDFDWDLKQNISSSLKCVLSHTIALCRPICQEVLKSSILKMSSGLVFLILCKLKILN